MGVTYSSRHKEPHMLTTADAAQKLGISVRRVQVLIQVGLLPATKHGRDWLITEQDLAQMPRRAAGWPRGRKRKAEDESA
jgi:excisionase family DNA binding protein